MKHDVAVSLAPKDSLRAEETSAGKPVGDSNGESNSFDQSIGMVREKSAFTRLPPVQPFPFASKDSSRSDEAPSRGVARDRDVGRNSIARAPLPAAEQPSIGRRIFRSVAGFFIMALTAVLTSIVVNSALQSHGDEAKEMVMTWGSSLGGSSSAWQSRGDEAKRMVKEAWASSWDRLMKNLPPAIAVKQQGSSPAIRDAAASTEPPPVAAAAPFESVQQLKAMAQDLTVVRQKLVQLTAAQQQMAQKIASLQALQQDIKQKESSPPSSPATAVPLRKNAQTVAPRSILRDWRISHARNGYVYVQGHGKVYRVVPGMPLPGVGPVEQIKRQNGRWVVMTPKGIIASMHDLELDDYDLFDGD